MAGFFNRIGRFQPVATGRKRPEVFTGMRLENELIQWASEMTVYAGTLADIFPRIKSCPVDADPIKEDKNNENIIHRFARNFIANSNITILRG
jgi:hypothetical protein